MDNAKNKQNIKIPDKVCRLKFGQKEHVEALYETGEMFFNTFQYFKNLEISGDGRADKREYINEYYAGDALNGIEIIFNDYKITKEGGLDSFETDYKGEKEYSHLYSMSYLSIPDILNQDEIIDERNFAEGKDYVLLIHNVVEFKKRILSIIKDLKLKCKESYIEYFPLENFGGEIGCFRKTNEYSYQNEWRIVANFGSNTPEKIYIGSLKDIAFPPVNKKQFYEQRLQIGSKIITNKNIIEQYKAHV